LAAHPASLDGKQLSLTVNPDEAVAYGAAMQAAVIQGVDSKLTRGILPLDSVPFSLGIEGAGGIMAVIIPRNSSFPARQSQTISAESDNQSRMIIKVYDGESPRMSENNLLGTFDLTRIPPAPRGVPQITVAFDLNSDGILTVSAQEISTGNVKKVTIKNEEGLSLAALARMIEEAERSKAMEEKLAKKAAAKDALDAYCLGIRKVLSQLRSVESEISDVLAWSEADKGADPALFETKLLPLFTSAYVASGG
jgi:L1 cell adhesion molecule like protein